MQSVWRVACVRIPRFPIGAVWQRAEEERRARMDRQDQQLSLLPVPEAAPPSVLTADGSSSPISDASSSLPHWDELPIALTDGTRLRAVTAAAGRLHVRAGMTVAAARADCARLEVLPWDDVTVAQALVRATAALLIASPHVTPVAGALWTSIEEWIEARYFDDGRGSRWLRSLLPVHALANLLRGDAPWRRHADKPEGRRR